MFEQRALYPSDFVDSQSGWLIALRCYSPIQWNWVGIHSSIQKLSTGYHDDLATDLLHPLCTMLSSDERRRKAFKSIYEWVNGSHLDEEGRTWRWIMALARSSGSDLVDRRSGRLGVQIESTGRDFLIQNFGNGWNLMDRMDSVLNSLHWHSIAQRPTVPSESDSESHQSQFALIKWKIVAFDFLWLSFYS